MIIEYAMTEIIKEDIKTWQKTEGIKTIYEIGAKEDFSLVVATVDLLLQRHLPVQREMYSE